MGRNSALRRRLAGLHGLLGSFLTSRRRNASTIPTLDEFRSQLRRNLTEVVETSFPRTLDTEHGGFLCDFDHAWRPNGAHRKRLEFQARQTRAAAQAAIFDKGFRNAYAAAEHGLRYLTDVMWDHRHGGLFYLLHRDGTPVSTRKHLRGFAYAIQAGVEHHRLTGETRGLAFAKATFDWVDARAHDPVNGGYHPFLEQDGTPVEIRPSENPLGPLGVRIGLRDANTVFDLIDAFA